MGIAYFQIHTSYFFAQFCILQKIGLNIVLKKEEEEEEEKVNNQCWIRPCGHQMSSLGHRLI